ncbi:MAG: response regulator [Syntrophomonadaceae bacterium]
MGSTDEDSRVSVEKSSQTYYRDLFNSIGDAILVLNISDQWELLEINQAVTDITGYTLENFPSFSYTFQNLDTPLSHQQADDINRKAAAGQPQIFDWFTRRRDGGPLWLEIVLNRVNLDGNDRLLCIARDITERIEAASSLEKALEASEVASRAREVFLARLGHELRTPLFGIMGMAELLLSTELNEKQENYATVIRESSSMLSGIITGILDDSRLDLGKMQSPDTINLNAMLELLVRVNTEMSVENGMVNKALDIIKRQGDYESLSTVAEVNNNRGKSDPWPGHPHPLPQEYQDLQETLIEPGKPMPALETCNILIVDDDPVICDYLTVVLGYEGYSQVKIARTAHEAISQINILPPDAVILDYILPDISGHQVCSSIRGLTDAVIIMISARDDVAARVACLKAGADDYLLKPFRFEELLARIEALLRRRGFISKLDYIAYADLKLWPGKRLVCRRDRFIKLTPTEFNLLHLFMLNPGQVLSKDLILQHLRGYDYQGDENIAEVYIRYLRRKLGSPPIIHTRRGVGYVMVGTEAAPIV